jgi:hypothetical protein
MLQGYIVESYQSSIGFAVIEELCCIRLLDNSANQIVAVSRLIFSDCCRFEAAASDL